MGDEAMRRRREREAEEYRQYSNPANQQQRLLDYYWTLELARRAERAYRRRAPDERSRDGSDVITEYDPIARYERETGRR